MSNNKQSMQQNAEMKTTMNETPSLQPQQKPLTIISALDEVLEAAHDSKLSEDFFNSCEAPLSFLAQALGLTPIQVVLLALLVDHGDTLSWRGMGKFLGCSRLSMIVHSEEMDDLVAKRWVLHRKTREMGTSCDGYMLARGVVKALRRNQPFVPEKIDGLCTQEFVERMERYLDKNLNEFHTDFEDVEEWLMELCKANPTLPLCEEVLRYDDIHVQALLLLAVYDFAQWADSDDEGLTFSSIDNTFPEEYETGFMRHELRDGSHMLIKRGILEHKCDDGTADVERYMLTRKAKEVLLTDYKPSKSKCMNRRTPGRNLRHHDSIKEKRMFYNATEQEQIERLTSLLSQDNLPGIQQRLEDEGMRKGFACLFFGAPGTGKTETVLQIARATSRDIMQVDIAGMRDKYVGESEKNIKGIFTRYRDVCKHSEVTPILFFNEADAIFGKRTTVGGNNPSVEKMDNAMQNIILQEMEDLDGILIATTNLTCNHDAAFERRFLFKVEFEKPDEEVKAKLWTSMLGEGITDEDARRLASRYDFSGGQIENIARKCTVEYILSGKKAGYDEIDEFCQHELLDNRGAMKPIVFKCA